MPLQAVAPARVEPELVFVVEEHPAGGTAAREDLSEVRTVAGPRQDRSLKIESPIDDDARCLVFDGVEKVLEVQEGRARRLVAEIRPSETLGVDFHRHRRLLTIKMKEKARRKAPVGSLGGSKLSLIVILTRDLTADEEQDVLVRNRQSYAILANDPQNAEALQVQSEARQALDEIDAAVTQARAALARGATAEAAEALGRVLALDPSHPLGAELNDQLNQHFQSQAEGARAEMETARDAAASARASGRAEFRQADLRRQEASADFNRGEYTNAAQKYLAARDQFQQSVTAHRQAEDQRRAQAERQAASQADARAAFERAQNEWTRLRNQPADAGVASQPSYQRAMSEEASAKVLERSGDLAGAARAYGTATSYLETARQEYAEAQSRRAAVAPPPAPTSVPSTSSASVTSSAPSRAQEETAIRQTLATYERAIESENLDLFRQAKPDLTRDEAKRLTDSFAAIDSHDVELDVHTVTIEGDTATVSLTRRDVIVIRGRSQNGKGRQQSFVFSKNPMVVGSSPISISPFPELH